MARFSKPAPNSERMSTERSTAPADRVATATLEDDLDLWVCTQCFDSFDGCKACEDDCWVHPCGHYHQTYTDCRACMRAYYSRFRGRQ